MLAIPGQGDIPNPNPPIPLASLPRSCRSTLRHRSTVACQFPRLKSRGLHERRLISTLIVHVQRPRPVPQRSPSQEHQNTTKPKHKEKWNSWSWSRTNPRRVLSSATGRRVVKYVCFEPSPSCRRRRHAYLAHGIWSSRAAKAEDPQVTNTEVSRASTASQTCKDTTGYTPTNARTRAQLQDVERASSRGVL